MRRTTRGTNKWYRELLRTGFEFYERDCPVLQKTGLGLWFFHLLLYPTINSCNPFNYGYPIQLSYFVAWILGSNIKYMGVLRPSKWRKKKGRHGRLSNRLWSLDAEKSDSGHKEKWWEKDKTTVEWRGPENQISRSWNPSLESETQCPFIEVLKPKSWEPNIEVLKLRSWELNIEILKPRSWEWNSVSVYRGPETQVLRAKCSNVGLQARADCVRPSRVPTSLCKGSSTMLLYSCGLI